MPPVGSVTPGSNNSSPVDIIATRNLRKTFNEVKPSEAAKPTSCGLNFVPKFNTFEPSLISSPRYLVFAPFWIPGGMITFSILFIVSILQSSCIKTVSGDSTLPLGICAPVNIRMASPHFCIRGNGWPAVARPPTISLVSFSCERSS